MTMPTPQPATSTSIDIPVRRLAHGADLPLPSHKTVGSAGLDLPAAIPQGDAITLEPGCRALVPTGIAIELPWGFEGQIRPRSGLALRHGLTVLNSPGTIDSDYRGEIQVLMINLGEKTVSIERGMQIAQLVVGTAWRVAWRPVEELADSVRGGGGFGSTDFENTD